MEKSPVTRQAQMNKRFLLRELSYGRGQAFVFILCAALSLISIVAINGLRRDIHQSLESDARDLSGGDIILHSHYDFSPGILAAVQELTDNGEIMRTQSWEFMSMARDVAASNTVLSQIKAVQPGYPFYGEIALSSGRSFHDVLQAGRVVVSQSLLTRLGLSVGDDLLLGESRLTIADTILRESLRPVDFLSFGPRIFVAAVDLPKLGLLGMGSRSHYEFLIKVIAQENIDKIAESLQSVAIPGQERVRTYASAGSRVKRFFDNLLFFLSLTTVFTMLLAGIGMQSSLTALLRQRERSLAIIRSLGATGGFVNSHYLVLVLVLCLIGNGLGIVLGLIIEKNLGILFAGILPPDIELGGSFTDVVEGLVIGLVAALFFTFLPLLRLKEIKPSAIFRRDMVADIQGRKQFFLVVLGVLLFGALIIYQLDDLRIGLYFLGGTLGLIAATSLGAIFLLRLLARIRIKSLVLRQAGRSLLRPGNSSRSVIVTLGTAMALLLSLYLVERNLHAGYIASYPEGAPNLFCLDIQKDQREAFLALTGDRTTLFPVIRARLISINGEMVNREQQRNPRGDSLVREFNLTYRNELLDDEALIKGNSLFGGVDTDDIVPVSILDTVAEMGDMRVGDLLEFNIQGVRLKAKVSSVRERTRSMLYPFFYFVFPENVLAAAPQTFFGALTVDKGKVAELELAVVNNFPNVSTIDVGATAAELGRIMRKLSVVITFFASFSILAGALLLVSSILATRLERSREAVYYKILGAGSRFVQKIFLFENLLLALISGGCSLLLSQLISWAVCKFLLSVQYEPHLLGTLVMVSIGIVLVVSLGLVSSMTIIRRKPAQFLREQG